GWRGFSALVPIPNGRGRHRAAPFGVGPWDGARVASQQSPILRPGQLHGSTGATNSGIAPRQEGRPNDPTIRPGCSIRVALQLEIPPVWADSNVSLDTAASARNGGGQAVRRGEWSGPDSEEFALD